MINIKNGKYTYVIERTNLPVLKGEYKFYNCQLEYTNKNGHNRKSDFIMKKIDLPDNYTYIISNPFLNNNTKLKPTIIDNLKIDEEIEKPNNKNAFFVLKSKLNGTEHFISNTIAKNINDYSIDLLKGPK